MYGKTQWWAQKALFSAQKAFWKAFSNGGTLVYVFIEYKYISVHDISSPTSSVHYSTVCFQALRITIYNCTNCEVGVGGRRSGRRERQGSGVRGVRGIILSGQTVRVFHDGLSTENLKQSQNASIQKTGGLFIQYLYTNFKNASRGSISFLRGPGSTASWADHYL